MTTGDYELLASTLRYCAGHCDDEKESEVVSWVTGHIADALERERPRFDREAFVLAATLPTAQTRSNPTSDDGEADGPLGSALARE